MIVSAVFVHCGLGLILAALSVPLVLRRVPMNRAYGILVREAFTSDGRWYDINAYGGRLFLIYGLVMATLGFVVHGVAPPTASPWSAVFFAVPLLGTLALLPPIRSYARHRVQQEPAPG